MIILEIDKNGTVIKFTSLVEDYSKSSLDKELNGLLNLKNAFCPGFYFLKKENKKEIRKSSDFVLKLKLNNGIYEETAVLYL